MDIVVSENVTGGAMDALHSEFGVAFDPELWNDVERLKRSLAEARALIVRNQTSVTAEVIAAAPRLQVVGRAGAGLDNIDTDAATAAGVVVTYAPHENSVSVAELAMGMMLSLARKLPAADRDTRAGGWDRREFTGTELSKKTLGVIGLGCIGTLVAQRARAFGMTIIAHDDYVDPKSDHLRDLDARLVSLDELLTTADFITCHVPLTDETRGLFNDERLRRLKPTAILVNTSRGEVIDEAALLLALEENRIGGVALDVRTVEPPKESLLNTFDNVILTPHIAAFTHEAQDRVVAAVCRDVAAVLNGGKAANAFNLSVPSRKGVTT